MVPRFSFGPGSVVGQCSGGGTQINPTPTADTAGPHSGDEGSNISLDGSGSMDSDATIASYAWSIVFLDNADGGTYALIGGGTFSDPGLGDTHTMDDQCDVASGNPATSMAVTQPGFAATCSYANAGIYRINVTITDDDGGADDVTSDYIVVYDPSAGSKAQFKGTGKVNGVDGYGFMLSAIDGGKNSPDNFRIKIWDTYGDGDVIYDNLAGGSDTDDPTTALGGGSIVIHAK
jgi:hypothetical protein